MADIYSQYGGSAINSPDQGVDYSKYGGSAIPQQAPANAPFYKSIVPDIVSGLATGGQDVNQFLNNALGVPQRMRPAPIDMQQLFNAPKPQHFYDPNAIVQGAAAYAPAGPLAEMGLAESALQGLGGQAISRAAPYLAKGANTVASYLSRSPLASQMANQGIAGATGGTFLNPNNPIQGALQGGLLNSAITGGVGAAGKGINTIFGGQDALNSIGNAALNKIRSDSLHGAALSPESTAENIASNYTNQYGQPVPADIGTLTNNALTGNVYGALKYSPFSGVSKQMNLAKSQLADKAISDTQNQMTAAGQDPIENDLRNKILATGDQQQLHAQNIQNIGNQLGAVKNDLQNKLSSDTDQQNQISQKIQSSPDLLNSLKASVPTDTTPASYMKNGLYNEFKSANNESEQNYDPINNSDFRIDKLGLDNPFPNYSSAVKDLSEHKQELANLFGSSSDLSGQLQGEINKGTGLINNTDKVGATLPDVVKRVQSLNQLAAAAKAQGNRNEGRLLSNMGEGLHNDTINLLKDNGREDLANQLNYANEFHKNNVIPFYNTPQIRQSVVSKTYVPKFASLSKELHDPNNQSVLQKLPDEYKNTGLYGVVSGSKGTSAGVSNLKPNKIASVYSNLDPSIKSQIASYNPGVDQYLESLSSGIENHDALSKSNQELARQLEMINNGKKTNIPEANKYLDILKSEAEAHKNLSDTRNELSKQLESVNKANQATQEKLAAQLEQQKKAKFGAPTIAGASSSAAPSIIKTAIGTGAAALAHLNPSSLMGSVPAILAGRTIAQALRNPELINAYLKGINLPGSTPSALGAISPYMTTAPILQQGNQQ